jgi:hypothetical protein
MRITVFGSLVILSLLYATAYAVAGETWNPPARFDHAYHGQLTAIQLPRPALLRKCRAMMNQYHVPGRVTRGCSIVTGPHSCTVMYVNRPYHNTLPRDVLRHEIGHCNGWPWYHPK